MKKNIIFGVCGLVLGIILTGLFGFLSAPSAMINESESSMSFDETVEQIIANAEELDWKVPATHEIHNSVARGGYDVDKVTVIELCNVDLAGEILTGDDNRIVSSMMPCRVAVYETSDGRVIISRMNTGLMSSVFGGKVREIMALATDQTEIIIGSLID
ncbi:MAG: DUF302 domain-containing protein [Candidatus Fermentibacteraceae bacterium]|nr:DUF302 domain-containing protein [Candidatus Fermentibacteraceae bacterium]